VSRNAWHPRLRGYPGAHIYNLSSALSLASRDNKRGAGYSAILPCRMDRVRNMMMLRLFVFLGIVFSAACSALPQSSQTVSTSKPSPGDVDAFHGGPHELYSAM
jgi:hypothetical protein